MSYHSAGVAAVVAGTPEWLLPWIAGAGRRPL